MLMAPVMPRIHPGLQQGSTSQTPSEIATDPPGFTTDERLEELGHHLCLPPWMERARAQIEAILAPITLPLKAKP
jgi:hypothetical protein